MIKFTLVTITYNAESVFMRTAESVLAQTYHCVEHIIVDGASKDGTADMAMEYKRRSDGMANGHEVRVVSEPDKGLYDAMNKGLPRHGRLCVLSQCRRLPARRVYSSPYI